jgi:N-acetylmuramic acid 6-phosphate etherase
MEPTTEVHAVELADLDRRPTVEVVRAVVRGHAAVLEAVEAAEPAIAALADAAAERMDAGGRVIYVGAGSGGRLAAADAAEWGPTFSVPDAAVVALVAGAGEVPGSFVEAAAEDDAEAGAAAIRALAPTPRDVVIGVTASGRTPYVLGAIAAAARPAPPLGETAPPASTPAPTAAGRPLLAAVSSATFAAPVDVRIEVPVGAEAIAGSTRLKAGTAQKLVLNAFSTAVMVRRGRTYGNLMAGMRVANAKLRERAVRVCVLATSCTETEARAALQSAHDDVGQAVVMLAAGLDAPTARARLDASNGAIRRAVEKWS